MPAKCSSPSTRHRQVLSQRPERRIAEGADGAGGLPAFRARRLPARVHRRMPGPAARRRLGGTQLMTWYGSMMSQVLQCTQLLR